MSVCFSKEITQKKYKKLLRKVDSEVKNRILYFSEDLPREQSRI